jgi:hypothetical protein
MFTRVCLSIALFVSIPAWSQVSTSEGVGLGITDEMLTPPPVNGDAYPTAVSSEIRSNYLRGGLVVTTEHTDNVLGGSTANPISDFGYSVYPTLEIDRSSPRLKLTLSYSPGFTLYQHTSSRNQTDQYVFFNTLYRLSPHITATVRDNLRQTSSVLSANPLSGGAISGSPEPPLTPVIGPVGDQLFNNASVELTDQFSRNAMIGVSGGFTTLHFLDPKEVIGLYDSSASKGSVFYNHRLSRKHYIGATYQYSKTLAYPQHAVSEVQTNIFSFFYTIYLKPTFSLSISGGPQHYIISQSPLPALGTWSPFITAGSGWQGRHTSFSATYSRIIFGGGGLVGVFKSDVATTVARWQFARTWSVGLTGTYGNNKDVTPSSFLSTEGGHSLLETISAQHQLGPRLELGFGYTHLHQSYGFIPVLANAPNTNNEFVSISYHFSRPLGG